MASTSVQSNDFKSSSTPAANYKLAFALVCSLFFLWGFAISMLDGLNRKFQLLLDISKAESAWVQVCTFGAYFIMAIPAGLFMKKYGYKKGIIIGLLLYAVGALAVYPSLEYNVDNPAFAWTSFLICLFIIACGLAILETAANPYATVLGDAKDADFRINLAQSFNGVGVISGPLVGGLLLFSDKSIKEDLATGFDSVQLPYLFVGIIVSIVMVLFFMTKLPEIEETTNANADQKSNNKLINKKHFTLGVLAQFFNVGGQACVWGFFINYMVESFKMSDQRAAYLLSTGMVIFMIGRFVSTFILKFIPAHRLLGIYCTGIALLLALVTFNMGNVSILSLMIFFFFQSITFPTIFSLAVKDVGSETKLAASFVIMAIVGGAVFPPVMGAIADNFGIATSFWLPAFFFSYIAWYSFKASQWR
jgi:MFS transporter, FHS family, L-fucose permease